MSQRTKQYARVLRRYHFIAAIVILTVVFIFEGWFLYRFFYRSIVATKSLIELKQQAALEDLKVPLFQELTKFYEEKQKKPPADPNLKDPFANASASTSSQP